MNKIAAMTLACLCCFSVVTTLQAAEEKTEIKTKKDGSWKMKVQRKGNDYVGVYEGKTYTLRGDHIRNEGEYTVYGTIDPEASYITTTRVEPYTTETVVTTPEVDDRWNMRVFKRDNHWYGAHEGHEYELRGDHAREEGEFTVHGRLSKDGYITTSRIEHR